MLLFLRLAYCFFYSFFINVKTITPNLPTKKVNIPKVGGRIPRFIPPAKIPGATFPSLEIMSKAFIKPKINPKKPNTSANKVIALISATFFSELFLKPLATK